MTMKTTLSGAKTVQLGRAHNLARNRTPRFPQFPWPPWSARRGGRLINGSAIRIARKLLKTQLRDHVRSTVKGVHDLRKTSDDLPGTRYQSHVTNHKSQVTSHERFLLLVPILINGSAIRIARKPLKTRLRDHLKSTVKGATRVAKYLSQLTVSESRIASHKSQVTSRGQRVTIAVYCLQHGRPISLFRSCIAALCSEPSRSS